MKNVRIFINLTPLNPTLIYSKTGVYRGIHDFSYFCLFLLKHIDCWYSLEPPRTIYVLSINMKNVRVVIGKLSVFGGEIFNKFE